MPFHRRGGRGVAPSGEWPGGAAAAHRGADALPSPRIDTNYVEFIKYRCLDYCRAILEAISVPERARDRIAPLSNAVGGFTSGVSDYESPVREDFKTISTPFMPGIPPRDRYIIVPNNAG